MRIVLTIDEELNEKIEHRAAEEDLKRNEWIVKNISGLISGEGAKDCECNELKDALEKITAENSRLRNEVKLQIDLRDAYTKLLDEKNNRIDDLKEEIARIEVLSVTATDQINQDKDDRIRDLNKMLEHLQGQAAAHSLALQSAIRSKEDYEKYEDDGNEEKSGRKELIEKPKWMFWK